MDQVCNLITAWQLDKPSLMQAPQVVEGTLSCQNDQFLPEE